MDESFLPGWQARMYSRRPESVRIRYHGPPRPVGQPAVAVEDVNSRFTHSVFGVPKFTENDPLFYHLIT